VRDKDRSFISPAKLIELIQQLPPEVDQVEANLVGNLLLTTPEKNFGYIDLAEETIEREPSE